MITRFVFAASCSLLAVLATASLRGDEPALRPADLSGKWIVTKLVIDGTEIPLSKLSDPFWEIEDDTWQYSFAVGGKSVTARFRVTLHANATDHSVDAKLLNGAYAGGICKGICRIEGDAMLLCLADKPSLDRPAGFECPEKSGWQLFELQRAKTLEPPQ